jgi:hypothetical protein
MVTREDGEPRAPVSLVMLLLGFAAGEYLGGFVAGFIIAQCKKFGGWQGLGVDGHKAGTYDMPSGRGFLRKHPGMSRRAIKARKEAEYQAAVKADNEMIEYKARAFGSLTPVERAS